LEIDLLLRIADKTNQRRTRCPQNALRPVEIHREFITAAARWMMAAKLRSVLSARIARALPMRLDAELYKWRQKIGERFRFWLS
jgi:hypothetical protein